MRFEIGQIIPFVHVSFHPREDVDQLDARSCRLFHPALHLLDDIEVKLLEVIEYHKVPGAWSDAPKYDGFILREVGSDDIWHNQYPRAAYGQIDVSADLVAVRKHDHFTEQQAAAMSVEELDRLLLRWPTALSALEAVYRALNGPEHERLKMDDEIRSQFESYHEQLKAAVENASGRRVEYCELEIGTPKLRIENCWKAVFTDETITKNAA